MNNHLRCSAQEKQTNKWKNKINKQLIDHCKHHAAHTACSGQIKQQ